MKPTISIRKALADKKLLGSVLIGDSWQAWRVLLIAAMGESLSDEERTIFTALTGRDKEPLQMVVGVLCRGRQTRRQVKGHGDPGGLCRWAV